MNLIVASLPDEYAHRTLQFVAKQLDGTQHVQFYLRWACQLLTEHGAKEDVLAGHTLLELHQNFSRKYEQLSKMCDFNKYTMRVLRSVEVDRVVVAEEEAEDGGSDVDDEDNDDGLLLVKATKSEENDDDDDDDADDNEEESSSADDE